MILLKYEIDEIVNILHTKIENKEFTNNISAQKYIDNKELYQENLKNQICKIINLFDKDNDYITKCLTRDDIKQLLTNINRKYLINKNIQFDNSYSDKILSILNLSKQTKINM